MRAPSAGVWARAAKDKPISTSLGPTFLGIETSCDETAVAIVSGNKNVLSNLVLSQVDLHDVYGGVVPEIAARAHADHLSTLVEKSLADTGIALGDLDGIAATAGPGLIGGVMVGLLTAKTLAWSARLPCYAINHLEGHALSARLVEEVPFPFLLLLISGGHCQILDVKDLGRYKRLSTTIDDAAGEAFDKLAKMLSLGYPGGPKIEAMAREGDPSRFALPRPLTRKGEMNFSFSGLKTAALNQASALSQNGEISRQDMADLCAGFQAAISDCLIDRLAKARSLTSECRHLVVAGGVAANKALRADLEAFCARETLAFHAPPLWLCGDNAAMIAWAGLERAAGGFAPDGLDFKARARWPLDPNAEAAPGAGVKA